MTLKSSPQELMLPDTMCIEVLFQDSFITDKSLGFQDKCLIFMPWVSEGNSARGRRYWKGQGMSPSAGWGYESVVPKAQAHSRGRHEAAEWWGAPPAAEGDGHSCS